MPRSRVDRRSSTLVIVVVATIAAAAGGYGLARFVGRGFMDVSISSRRHLDEIPIDRARACSHVESIHQALAALDGTYTAATFGLDDKTADTLFANGRPGTAPTTPITLPPWPTVAAGLDASAARLDLVIAAGLPDFPPRARRELRAIRSNIAAGRAALPKVTDAAALNLTRTAFDRGRLHAGYASDLVGDQCSVPLGA